MVQKTPKMFFRYHGEDMSLISIYNRNKKRRGRLRYLLSVMVNVVKDDEVIPSEVFFKVCKNYLNLSRECNSFSYDAMTAPTVIVLPDT